MTHAEALSKLQAYLAQFKDDELVGETHDACGCPLARALGGITIVIWPKEGGTRSEGLWLYQSLAEPDEFYPRNSVLARFVRAVDAEPRGGIVALTARRLLAEALAA